MLFNCVKNCANWCVTLKIWAIKCSSLTWYRSEKWVVDFIARWRHWCHKFVQYRVNWCIQN